MRRFRPEEKLAIIKEVEDGEQSVYAACRKHKISKVSFYKWLSRYKANRKNREISLRNRTRRGNSHPRSLTFSQRLKILSNVHKNPSLSSRRLAEIVGLGNHGVQNFLYKEGLNRFESRLEFAQNPFWKRESSDRREAMMQLQEQGWKIKDICRHFKVSKPTFYKWKKRFEQTRKSKIALADRFVKGADHYRFVGGGIENKIITIVSKNPEFSVSKIYSHLNGEVGRHGVQNVLARHNLGTYEQRLAFSRLSEEAWKPKIKPRDLPYIPLRIWRLLFAPFATIPKLAWLFTRGQIFLLFIFFLSFYFYKVVAAIITSPTGNPVGIFFASISLTFGLFFFVYSMKYYIAGFLVLKLAQSGAGQSQDGKLKSRFTKLLNKFGLNFAKRRTVNPLNINLEKVQLDGRRPFVSIHVALYNEKRVVERLINACISQEWYEDGSSQPRANYDPSTLRQSQGSGSSAAKAAYEVILVDDSTDETTEIILGFLRGIKGNYGKLREIKGKGEQIYKFMPDNPTFPLVTLIHRDNRSGFKGGALQRALENTDKGAQYIAVFDADFVPYPDTLEQFIKTFQVLNANENANANMPMDANISIDSHNSNSPTNSHSNIAAVQGYQWHVLNKGANWVTRGVRTEYAGSYVIERASEEIYQGLKQIAGSVFCIRADVIRKFGWGRSITEDFELTLKLYEAGYKVAFTPYIQGPAEAVSTIKRLIRQRMRWAEGASFNVKLMFKRMLKSPNLSRVEKLEFVYLAPYYLQAAFFIVGTLSWFLSEAVLGSRLPFWTVAFGWSLVLTNLLALPLMNIIGLFLEESEERDYIGILSFVALSYILVPFQAYAAIKGFVEKEEGPWFRTPKTGLITDSFGRPGFDKFFGNLFGGGRPVPSPVSADDGRFAQTGLSAFKLLGRGYVPALAFKNPVRLKYMRLAGNLALGFVVAITVLMSILAPFIPQAKLDVSANERQFATFSDSVKADDPVSLRENYQAEDGEIAQPFVVRYPGPDDKTLEYIFHEEPRVRTKYNAMEIEMSLRSFDGEVASPKESIKDNGRYLYRDVSKNIDLVYSLIGGKLTEELIVKKYQDLEEVEYSLETVGLVVAMRDNEVHFAPKGGGNPLFTFTKPYMYEDANPENKSFAIEYKLEKEPFGWKLKKVLTEEGEKWLSDPARVYPVILDPTQTTSTIQTAIATDESDYGQQQRKIVWANGALNGDAWYAVYEDAGGIFYEKCVPSVDGCETGTDWTDRTDIGESGGTADTDNRNPSVWWESDRAKMWAVWADNSRDNLQFVDIDVDASDPGTAGTLCSGADQANHNPTTWQVTITLDSSDTIYVSYVDTSTSTVNNMYRIATGGCTFTAILTSSGVDASDRPILLATGTQTLHAIFQDGTTLRHSVYVNDASPGWDSADTDITGADTDNTTTNYSAATDGTDIWLIADQGTSGVDLWTCAACAASSSWTNAADPWSSQGTDITEVSLTYSSETDDIIAFALRGSGATEEVIVKSTDSTTISWGAESSLGVFGGGASGLEDLSATMSTNADDKSAFVVEDATNSELEFSTVPENILFLLVLGPFLPEVFKRLKKRNDD